MSVWPHRRSVTPAACAGVAHSGSPPLSPFSAQPAPPRQHELSSTPTEIARTRPQLANQIRSSRDLPARECSPEGIGSAITPPYGV